MGVRLPLPPSFTSKIMEEEFVEETIELDDETAYLAACLAEERGITIQEVIIEAIKAHMEQYEKIPERY